MHVEIETSAGRQRHPNAPRTAVQLPRAFHLAVGVYAAAAGARAQATFDATKTDAARAGVYVNIAASREVAWISPLPVPAENGAATDSAWMLPLPVFTEPCGPRSCTRMSPEPVCNFTGARTP